MSLFMKEVNEQPIAIRKTIEFNKGAQYQFDLSKPLLFTGMGSSLAAGQLVSKYLNGTGIMAVSADTSELVHYQLATLEKYNIIIVSQSGESIEVKRLIENCPDATAVTNTPESTLASKAENVYFTQAGNEKAITATKSFTTTVALLLLLASRLVKQQEIESDILQTTIVIEKLLERTESIGSLITGFLDETRPIMLVGRGPSVTTADLCGLLLKEGARIFTESMSIAQFRHGPLELASDVFQCMFFNPFSKTYKINRDFAEDIANLGSKVVYISDHELDNPNILSIQIDSVSEFVSPIIYAVYGQLALYALSKKKGVSAGEAKLLTKVTVKE